MFKSLVSAVSEQRQEIKQALILFPYFGTWNTDLIAECCRVSSISEFPPDEIILGPDTGNSHTVYFVLEGICKMVRNLNLEVEVNSRQRTGYKLHKAVASGSFQSELKPYGYSSRLFNMIFQSQDVQFYEKNMEVEDKSEVNAKVIDEPEVNVKAKEELEVNVVAKEESTEENLKAEKPQGVMVNPLENTSNTKVPSEAFNKENSKTPNPEETSIEEKTEPTKVTYEPDHHLKILEESKKSQKKTTWFTKKFSPKEKPPNVKSFFIQIGFLHKGACFGLEKSERENYVLSATRVRCLKIPEGFLLRHNPYNIWKRIRLFHSLYLPKDERVYERFWIDRMWKEGKKKLTENVSGKNLANCTLICDAPYTIRLSELR